MPKCFSAWNGVLNKRVTMHFRHEKQMKHNGTRWMNILIFYSLIMSFSCATCMSTLGFCIIIFLFSGSLPSTTLHYNACAKHFQYYFALQNSHKALPSTTLRTTKLAQSPSQYYFVLQSLHKALPSTTLRTTKLAQSTSQYYFVLQSWHKALPSTTLHYKACTNYFPALLCTTKLAQTPEFLCVLAKGTTFAKHTSPRHNDFFLKQVRLCQMPVTVDWLNCNIMLNEEVDQLAAISSLGPLRSFRRWP